MADRSLMCVLAHPDDETFVTGGAIARYARAGARVTVLIATSGQAGRAAGRASTPEELGRVREAEAIEAARYLGIADVHFLRYMDGKLDAVDEEEAHEKVARYIKRERPDVVITFGPEGGGNEHRDHKAISRIATLAVCSAGDPDRFPEHAEEGLGPHLVKKFYYLSGRDVPWRKMISPFMPITTVIDISDVVEVKLAAFRLHRSQQELMPKLDDWIRANQNTEPYHRACSIVGALPELETDLFTGID